MENLAERIAWAIEAIKTEGDLDRNITDEALARKLGTNKNTIGDYRRKKGLIKGIVLERLATVYRFNPEWLLSGKGEPFARPSGKYPQTAVLPDAARETAAPFGRESEAAPVKISEAVRMAIEVLESDTSSARMLAWGIRQSYHAARLELRISRLQAEVDELKKRAKDKEPGPDRE